MSRFNVWFLVAVLFGGAWFGNGSSAVEVLGSGTVFLVGSDLTDIDNDGNELLYLAPDELAGFDAVFFSSDEPGFGGGEFAFNVFDNILGPGNDKWCCGTVFPQIVGADFRETSGAAYRLTSFTVGSANDVPERDPRVWRIEGSNDGECWSTIFSEDDLAAAVESLGLAAGSAIWTERFQVIRFSADEDYPAQDTAYSMFRMVTFQTGLVGGPFFQVGEIEFFGEEGEPPAEPPDDCPGCADRVVNLTCELKTVGLPRGVSLTWEIPEGCECAQQTRIYVNGVLISEVAANATTALLAEAFLPEGAFVVEVRNCSALGTFCSPFRTDNQGLILTSNWLALGPISNLNACTGDAARLLGNHLAPSFIQCEYPSEGDEPRSGVDFADPSNVALGFHPAAEAGGPAQWRRFQDSTPADGDLDMDTDIAGGLDAHMTWVATWVEYTGAPTTISLCVGSDDDVQVWINDRLAHNNPSCRGRGFCQDRIVIDDFQPGIYCIRMGVWENGGGWGGSLGLNDELGGPIVDGASDEWIFHGIERPATFEVPECNAQAICTPVANLTCMRFEDGSVELSWENPEACEDSIEIIVRGETIATLPADTTTYTVDPDDAPFTLSVAVSNGSFSAPSCSVAETVPGLIGSDLTDIDNDGVEGFYLPPGDLGGFDAVFFSSDEPGFGGGEFAFNVFDNIVGGGNEKWCCGTVFPQIVGADFRESTGKSYRLTEFTVSSANDTPDRDPRVWRIEGSNDDVTWETIFEQNNSSGSLWPQRLQVLHFVEGRDYPLQENAYSMFRMVTDATGMTSGAFFQVGEIEFFGEEGGVDVRTPFKRGDSNSDGTANIADASFTLNFLFLGGRDPTCSAAADANGDGTVNIADASFLLNFLFLGGRDLPFPFPDCGRVDNAACDAYAPCAAQ
jgi:hypothetical protein